MGSPYAVHNIPSVTVIRSVRGLKTAVHRVMIACGYDWSFDQLLEDQGLINPALLVGPECGLFHAIMDAFCDAAKHRELRSIYLEARYEWHGWEKFQRVMVFDLRPLLKGSALQMKNEKERRLAIEQLSWTWSLLRVPD